MAAYRVVAPYVTLKVRDQLGAWTITGFYDGAVVPGEIDPDSLRHHLDGGMVVEVGEAVAVPVAAEPASEVVKTTETPPVEPEVKRPHGNASAAAWLDYAVSRRAEGVSEEDARAALGEKTKADLMSEYGG